MRHERSLSDNLLAMARASTPSGPSLPSAILEAAIGLGTLQASYHETGAVRAAKASSRGDGPALVEVIIALLERAITLESLDVSASPEETEHVWRAILAAPRPTLQWLAMREHTPTGASLPRPRSLRPRMLAKLEATLPALQVLVLDGTTGAWSLGHVTLRELRLIRRPLKSLRALRAPSLERLSWGLPTDDNGVGSPRALVTPLWKPGVLPKLRELDVSSVVLDDAMWNKDMLTSDLLTRVVVLRAPGIEDPKLLLPYVARFKNMDRFEVPWIDGSGADELVRTLPILRVREREAGEEATAVEFGVMGDEGWVVDWRGFSAAAMKTIPETVRALSLHSVHWDDEEAAAFGALAGDRFERLRTTGGRVPGDSLVSALASTLATSRLTTLSLTRAPITKRSAEALGRALEGARALRTLRLALDDSGEGAAIALAQGLARSALEHLTLEGPWLAHATDGAALGKAVAASPLRSIALVLADAPPPSRGGASGALAGFVSALGQRPYERLAIDHSEGPGEFADGLPPTTALVWRRARTRSDASRGLGEGFASILRAQPQMRELDLLGTELMPEDVAALAAAVGSHPALESLRLSHVVLDEQSMRALAVAVRSSKTLSRVELFQDTSYQSRFRERFPYVSLAPLLESILDSERAFVLETHGEGEDEDRLVDMVRANRLRGLGASFRAGNIARLAAALPGARALASLDLRQSECDEPGLDALATGLAQSSLRSLAFTRYFGVYALGPRAIGAFANALARTNLEELIAPSPRREFLALGKKMSSLQRFEVRASD